MDAYCVRCKDQRPIKEVESVVLKNGRAADRGTCTVCGTTVFKLKAA